MQQMQSVQPSNQLREKLLGFNPLKSTDQLISLSLLSCLGLHITDTGQLRIPRRESTHFNYCTNASWNQHQQACLLIQEEKKYYHGTKTSPEHCVKETQVNMLWFSKENFSTTFQIH